MTLTSEQREKEELAILEIERRKKVLRGIPIRGYFTKKIVPNILLGMRLTIVKIDYLENIVTFKLAE